MWTKMARRPRCLRSARTVLLHVTWSGCAPLLPGGATPACVLVPASVAGSTARPHASAPRPLRPALARADAAHGRGVALGGQLSTWILRYSVVLVLRYSYSVVLSRFGTHTHTQFKWYSVTEYTQFEILKPLDVAWRFPRPCHWRRRLLEITCEPHVRELPESPVEVFDRTDAPWA